MILKYYVIIAIIDNFVLGNLKLEIFKFKSNLVNQKCYLMVDYIYISNLMKWNENKNNVLLKILHYLTLANEFTLLSPRKSYGIFEGLIKQKCYKQEIEGKDNDITIHNNCMDNLNIAGEELEKKYFSSPTKIDLMITKHLI